MIFASTLNSYTKRSLYKNDFCILKGVNECNEINGYRIPEGSSSIDKSYRIALIKQYNEQLERTKLGYVTFSNKKCLAYNLNKRCFVVTNFKDIGYGKTKFGVMDTTGTASGQICSKTLIKAYNEVLEKNEVGLIWYGLYGWSILIDESIRTLLKKNGIHYKNVFIFASRNLSNAIAFCVMIFDDDKRLISTGVSLNLVPLEALMSAIAEANLMNFTYHMINNFTKYSFFDIAPVYEYVENLYRLMRLVDFNSIKEYRAYGLKGWIKNIYATIINTKSWQDILTIRVFSEELLNCLPTKEYILNDINKQIIKEYNLINLLDNTPDCVII